jgi:hypothetical protein
VAIAGDSLYVAGGYRQYLSSKVYGNTLLQNLATEGWTSSAGALRVPRYLAKAVVLDGKPVLLGGTDGIKDLRDAESYDAASHTWTSLFSMMRPRSEFSAAVLNGKIYAIGGSSNGTVIGNAEAYTP